MASDDRDRAVLAEALAAAPTTDMKEGSDGT